MNVKASYAAVPVHAPGGRQDADRRMSRVAGPIDGRDDEGRRVVRLEAAVEQVKGLHDPARREHLLHGHGRPEEGLRVRRRVPGVGRLHVGHLRRGRPVLVHVAREYRREALPGAQHAVGPVGQIEPAHGRGRAGSRAADPELAVTVHRPEDHDGPAEPDLEEAHGVGDEPLRAAAPADDVGVGVEADAEVAGDGDGRRRVVRVIGEHAVDVTGRQPSVQDGEAHRLDPQRPGGPAGGAAVLRLADAHDRVAAAEVAHVSRGGRAARPRSAPEEVERLHPPGSGQGVG